MMLPARTDKEQSERFKETARMLGVDASGKKFEDVFEAQPVNEGL
jgi:hypothetical protein